MADTIRSDKRKIKNPEPIIPGRRFDWEAGPDAADKRTYDLLRELETNKAEIGVITLTGVSQGDILVYDGSKWVNQKWVHASLGVGTGAAPSYRLDVVEGITRLALTNTFNTLSGLRGLHIIKTDKTQTTSHGISWDVGTSGSGFAQWETGVDYDTNNANSRADFILVNDATANGGLGADCLRFSHEADDGVGGSASLKAILSHIAGSPRAFTSFFTVEAGDTLAGLNVSVNNSASGRNTITMTQRAANAFTAISCDNILRFGSDWSKTNAATFYIRDDNAGALRLFMDSSGRFSIGSGTSPTAMLHLPAGAAGASNAPLKLTSGTNLTSPEAGAFEYDGTELYFTRASTRLKVILDTAVSGTNLDLNGGALTCSGINNAGTYGGSGTAWAAKRFVKTFTSDADYTLGVGEKDCLLIDIQTDAVLSATRNLIVPTTTGGIYAVINRNAKAIGLKTSGGTAINVASQRAAIIVFPDGNNAFRLTPDTDYTV